MLALMIRMNYRPNGKAKSQIDRLDGKYALHGVAAGGGTCTIPAYAQQPDAPTPTPNERNSPAVADDAANAPDNATAITDPESMLPHFKDTRFWLSGQANFIFQTHPDFHADYSGPNSLSPRL